MVPRILITAGPTHEPLDAVRYLANRSSGRLGLALARATQERRLPTTLLLGPGPPTPPDGTWLSVVRFRTAEELRTAMHDAWPHHDLLLMAAAVADFRPAHIAPGKLDRRHGSLELELVPVPDLLKELASRSRPDQTRVGWALAPRASMAEAAKRKLLDKDVHAIVANPLETMGATTIDAVLYRRDAPPCPAPASLDKRAFAVWLLEQLLGEDQPPISNADTK